MAFGTDPSAVILRLTRQMKEEKQEMNICLETKDSREWFLRYLEVTAMVITTEIRPDKKAKWMSSVVTSENNMTKSIYLVSYDEFYLGK